MRALKMVLEMAPKMALESATKMALNTAVQWYSKLLETALEMLEKNSREYSQEIALRNYEEYLEHLRFI